MRLVPHMTRPTKNREKGTPTMTTVVDPRQSNYDAVAVMIRELKAKTVLQEDAEGVRNDFLMELMAGILNADSVDALYAAQNPNEGNGLVASKEFLDVPFIIESDNITWRLSDEKYQKNNGGLPFYAILNVKKMEDNTPVAVDAGGLTVVTSLFTMQKKGWLDAPRGMKFVGHEGSNGTYITLLPVALPAPNGKGRRA